MKFRFQARDMNDKGKGKAAAAATSSSPTVFEVSSPTAGLTKKIGTLSERKGKSKEQSEPLPGKILCSFHLAFT